MKRVLLPLLAVCLSSVLLHAENVERFTGVGTAQKAPEFVDVTLQIRTVCQPSAKAAIAAADSKAKEVEDLLNGIAGITHTTTSGSTRAYSDTIYEGNKPITICDKTFQKTVSIAVRSTDVGGWGQLFAEIQDSVSERFADSAGNTQVPVTYVEIGSPTADICDESKHALKVEGLRRAIADSREQIEIFRQENKLLKSEVKLTAGDDDEKPMRHEVNFGSAPRYAESSIGHIPALNTSFEDIVVTVTRTLSIKFPDISLEDIETR